MTRRGRRALIALGLLIGIWWLSGVAVLVFLTGRPAARFEEPIPPSESGRIEALRLATRDGEELGAWFIGAPVTGSGNALDEKAAVLLLHGYSGNRTWVLRRARPYADRGHPVLAPTLRAHGDSTGDRVDYGLSSRHDVLAAVGFLEARLPGRPIIIHGFSLGAAAAAFASTELEERVSAYVLDSPYETISIAARNRTRRVLIAPLADIAWLALLTAAPLRLDADALRPVDAVRGIPETTPVLILSGDEDTHALPAEARAIATAIGSNARVVSIPGATHDNLPGTAPRLYWSTVWEFLDREHGDGHSPPVSPMAGGE